MAIRRMAYVQILGLLTYSEGVPAARTHGVLFGMVLLSSSSRDGCAKSRADAVHDRHYGRKGELLVPASLTYPGVYVEEIPSGVRPITGVATSITAFVGRARRGPTDEPSTINNFGDFERIYGGLWEESSVSFAVRDFFRNGG